MPVQNVTQSVKSGRLFIVAAPSGAGKTSLVRALLESDPVLRVSVSHTTRPPRPNEQDGREYHFVTPDQFEAMVREDGFLEHAVVFGNRYGTGRAAVEAQLARGTDVVLEIDWQGARQVRAARAGTPGIFILPPSASALRQRLEGRATDSAEVIERRLAEARADMAHHGEFEYVIVNDSFDQALADLRAILRDEGGHLRSDRAVLQPLVKSLLAEPLTG